MLPRDFSKRYHHPPLKEAEALRVERVPEERQDEGGARPENHPIEGARPPMPVGGIETQPQEEQREAEEEVPVGDEVSKQPQAGECAQAQEREEDRPQAADRHL